MILSWIGFVSVGFGQDVHVSLFNWFTAGDLKVETLAEKAGMSPRTFARAYTNRTGVTPASAVEALRVETARLLLENSKIGGVVEVARRAGFGDDERMRRAFVRHLGVSPSEYRSRFSG